MKRLDLAGKNFGKLTVISMTDKRGKWGGVYWLCKCDCGHDKVISAGSLMSGRSNGCGFCKVSTRKLDLKGLSFGCWHVIKEEGRTKYKGIKWLCKCSCGTERVVSGGDLTLGNSQSCGCSAKKYTTSWAKRHPEKANEYSYVWRIKNRDKYLKRVRKANRKRLSTPTGKLNASMGSGIYYALKNNKAGRHWETLVGYTTSELISHIENLFQAGMTWENMGQWHIDHVKPKSLFNYNMPEDNEFKECWSLENLQPLWEKDNLKKGSKFNGINHIYYESNSMD